MSRNHFILFCIIMLGVFMLYGNSLRNGYVHDDHGQIEDNTFVHSLRYLPKAITGCIWESATDTCKNSLYYRPLQSVSYLLTYRVSKEPWIFHLINLFYFTIDVFLVFVLARKLTAHVLTALLATFIFLIHPLNTEVVNWASAVPELLFVMFSLLATIQFINYRKFGTRTHFIWAWVFFGLGVFSKEPAIFLPLVFVVLDLTYFKTAISELFHWKYIRQYLVPATIIGVYTILRFAIVGGLGIPGRNLTFVQHIYTFFDLFAQYIQKLVFPYPFNYFYTFHPIATIMSARLFISVTITLLYIGAMVIAWKQKHRTTLLSLTWLLIFLLPGLLFTSSIGENLFAERHAFASTVGFSILIAMLLCRLWDRNRNARRITTILFIIISIASIALINERIRVWHDDERLVLDALAKSPDADLIRYNLAVLYRDRGDIAKARQEFQMIIGRNAWQGLYKTYNNMGDIERQNQNFDEAIRYFNLAIAQNPFHKNAYNNLGALYFEQGKLLSSLTNLCKALLIDPSFASANQNYEQEATKIQGMDVRSFSQLIGTLTSGNDFRPASASQAIAHTITDCTSYPQGCVFKFLAKLTPQEFMFPFLVAGRLPNGTIIRPIGGGFDPKTNQISIGIARQYQYTPMHVIFPTCDGIYYDVPVLTR